MLKQSWRQALPTLDVPLLSPINVPGVKVFTVPSPHPTGINALTLNQDTNAPLDLTAVTEANNTVETKPTNN